MVMISHDRGFIFLKTRKTAGTTIEMLLEPHCAPPGHVVREETPEIVTAHGVVGARLVAREDPDLPIAQSPEWRNHLPAAIIRERLGDEVWSRYVKITAVRNPFDRVVSMFHWRRRKTELPTGPALREAFRRFIARDWPDDRDVVLIGGRFVADRALRYETLGADIASLSTELGLGIDPSAMPHTKNFAARRGGLSTADHYDEDTIEVVRNRLSWVFEHFDYAGTPDSAPRPNDQEGLHS
jgi:hypothetical protein